jgi:hypothetical protein
MTSKIKVYEADLADFQQDPSNANLGTERGTEMLRKSIEEVGAGRSLVADKNNLLPAGNKTQAAALALGVDKAIVVETEGDALIIHKRTDWDLTDEDPNNPARRYGYFDGQMSVVSLECRAVQGVWSSRCMVFCGGLIALMFPGGTQRATTTVRGFPLPCDWLVA